MPHCTHLVSMKRSSGRSAWGWSRMAPSGQAPTQARHMVQLSRLTAIVPKGAPAASAIVDCGVGACASRCSTASAMVARLSAAQWKVAGARTASAGCNAHNDGGEPAADHRNDHFSLEAESLLVRFHLKRSQALNILRDLRNSHLELTASRIIVAHVGIVGLGCHIVQ